jgi:hypothetical protein
MRRTWRASVLGLLIAAGLLAAAGWVGPSPALAQSRPSHEVVFDPDPPVAYGEMTATVTRDDCPAGDEVSARLELDQLRGDVILVREMAHDTAIADADGAVTLVLEVDTAYPGSWRVESICGDDYDTAAYSDRLEVLPPPEFVASIEPTSVRRGETVTLSVSGAACFGEVVGWDIAFHPIAWLVGSSVEPGPDGAWEQHLEVTVPEDFEADELAFEAQCIHADDIWVRYAGTPFRVLPARAAPPTTASPTTAPPTTPPPTTTSPTTAPPTTPPPGAPAPPAEPQPASPSFAG